MTKERWTWHEGSQQWVATIVHGNGTLAVSCTTAGGILQPPPDNYSPRLVLEYQLRRERNIKRDQNLQWDREIAEAVGEDYLYHD